MDELSPRAQAKADQIRGAAQKLFLAHGVGATSMDAITAEAGVSKQTVYAYFPSKDALVADVLDALIVQGTQPWHEEGAKRQIGSWEDLESELAAFANRVTGALMDPEYLGALRVVVAEAGANPDYGALVRTSVADPILRAVRSILQAAVEGGVLADAPHDDTARMLVGSILSFVLTDGLLRPDDVRRPSPRRIRRLVTFFVQALQASSERHVLS